MPDLVYLHPMIVHFPIALLIIGFLAEIVGLVTKKQLFSGMAFILLLVGAAGTVAAYISGGYAGDGITEAGSLKNALDTHEEAAFLTLVLICSAAILSILITVFRIRLAGVRWFAVLVFLAGVLSIARTGYYGGELVFKHAAGVRISLDLAPTDSEEPLETPGAPADSSTVVGSH